MSRGPGHLGSDRGRGRRPCALDHGVHPPPDAQQLVERLADDVLVQVVAQPAGQRRGRRRQREHAVGELVHLRVLQQGFGRALVPLDDGQQLGPDAADVGRGQLAVGRRRIGRDQRRGLPAARCRCGLGRCARRRHRPTGCPVGAGGGGTGGAGSAGCGQSSSSVGSGGSGMSGSPDAARAGTGAAGCWADFPAAAVRAAPEPGGTVSGQPSLLAAAGAGLDGAAAGRSSAARAGGPHIGRPGGSGRLRRDGRGLAGGRLGPDGLAGFGLAGSGLARRDLAGGGLARRLPGRAAGVLPGDRHPALEPLQPLQRRGRRAVGGGQQHAGADAAPAAAAAPSSPACR